MTDSPSHCLNCGASLQGKFCHECGQKAIEPKDRTVKYFLIQFLGSAFFLENNFVKSLWTLIAKPGRMTQDVIEGKRKKWMSPISLFLLINLFYFGFTRLTDLNLSLNDQLHQPHHSALASYLVDRKLSKEDITLEDLSSAYNRKSSTFANTLIILHVPIFAGFLALLFFKKSFFYTDHFIYGLHFVSMVLLLGLIQSGLISLFSWLHLLTKAFWPVFGSILLGVIMLYAFMSIKKVYQHRAVYAALLVLPVMVMFAATHMIYRTIQFLLIISLI